MVTVYIFCKLSHWPCEHAELHNLLSFMLQQLLPVLLKKPQTGESIPLLSTLCVLICNVAQPHTPLLVERFCRVPLGTRSTMSCNCICIHAIAVLSKVQHYRSM